MILGMSTHAFTLLHVIVSLAAIASGVTTLCGLLANQLYRRGNSLFLVAASLTSITGFAFPNTHVTPGVIVGVLSLIALTLAAIALYVRNLHGAFRGIFVVSTVVALYFDMFVLVAQLFRHVAVLAALDRTGQGPAFAVAQLLVLVLFIWLGIAVVRRFTRESLGSPQPAIVRPPSIQSQSE
jgi:hypothetical protein